jgi:hypothetical protein
MQLPAAIRQLSASFVSILMTDMYRIDLQAPYHLIWNAIRMGGEGRQGDPSDAGLRMGMARSSYGVHPNVRNWALAEGQLSRLAPLIQNGRAAPKRRPWVDSCRWRVAQQSGHCTVTA